jgi:quercetin dioxygenase-like cupin family protein
VAGTELVWRPLRAALGARVAGIGGYTVELAGQEVVEGHSEAVDGRGHEELYIVLRGRARFGLDGEELDAPTGTFVLVRDPAVPRRAVAAEPDTAVVAVGGPPVFEPTGSEWVERARPHLRDDPERARVVLDELCRERPASPGLRLGEALLAAAQGDADAARAALRDGIAREPRLRAVARDEPSLAAFVEEL